MSVKVEASVTHSSVSPSAAMASLSAKTVDRKVALKILEGVFPYDEYPQACSILTSVSRNTDTVTVGSLFDITAQLSSGHSNDHYTSRLVGRLCMENLATFEDLQQLSLLTSQTAPSQRRKLHEERTETYHMRSCYCQFDEHESESEDSS